MPAYVNSPNAYAPLLQKGVNCYLFGSFNALQANTRINISNVALTTNVATITGTIVEGEVPKVGALISITQTTSTAGTFNVSRATVTASTFDNNGVGTVTFALTHANVASAADFGTAIVEVPEVGEALVNGASIACCLQAPDCDSQETLTAAVTFPSLPTAATVVLQQALRNVAGEFTTVLPVGGGTAATVAAGAQTVGPTAQYTLLRGNFYRFLVSGVSGGSSPTIIAKLV